MKDIYLIKTGDSIPSLVARRGDFEDWVIAGMANRHPVTCRVVAVHRGERLPDVDGIGGIVITGSHAMVTDHRDWSEKAAAWLAKAVRREIPVLGICYGHQLLAYALGGKVGYPSGGPEFGTVPVTLTAAAANDPLLENLPRTIDVQTSHYQSVTALPSSAVLLGFSEKDRHSTFRWGPCAWGVQFHPEYDRDIAEAYIKEYHGDISKNQCHTVLSPHDCKETTAGRIILGRFATLVERGVFA